MENSLRSKVAWSLESMDPKCRIISLNSCYLFVGLSAFSFVFINWEVLLVWDQVTHFKNIINWWFGQYLRFCYNLPHLHGLHIESFHKQMWNTSSTLGIDFLPFICLICHETIRTGITCCAFENVEQKA